MDFWAWGEQEDACNSQGNGSSIIGNILGRGLFFMVSFMGSFFIIGREMVCEGDSRVSCSIVGSIFVGSCMFVRDRSSVVLFIFMVAMT